MTTQHPITPPPELVQQWCHEDGDEIKTSPRWYQIVATKAARWGANQELEACCEWLRRQNLVTHCALIPSLLAARRPKPPSLKEQALMALEDGDLGPGASLTPVEVCTIRRALEQLDD